MDLLYAIVLQISRVDINISPRQGSSGYEETCSNIDRYDDTGFHCFFAAWEYREGAIVYVEQYNYWASTQDVIDLMEATQNQPAGMLRSIVVSTEW